MSKANMHKLGEWEYSEDELERMLLESDRRGKQATARELRAGRVRYVTRSRRLVLDLENGTTVILPILLLDEFAFASAKDIAAVRLRPRGAALHWYRLDLDFSVAGLIAAVIRSQAPAGRGQKRGSPRSAETARTAAKV